MPKFQSVSTQLPPDVVRALRPHMAAEPRDPAALLADVRAFRDKVHHHASSGVFVDLGLADRLASKLEDLFALLPKLPSYERTLVQAAALYFLDEDDSQSDLQSSFGFDDDALVVDAVAKLVAELLDGL